MSAAASQTLVSRPSSFSSFQSSCSHFGTFQSSKAVALPASKVGAGRRSSLRILAEKQFEGNAIPLTSNRGDSLVPSAATISVPGTEFVIPPVKEKQVDYEQVAKDLLHASPLEIMDKALSMFGNDIAIAFSGAEDVALIEYAHLTGRPFRVFSLDTGRLNPETYRLFAEVEKHYKIRIEYMFPEAAEVEQLVRTKGLFSFYEDGHQECCRIRKVKPLRRALKGLRAWITGQRRDQSPGTRLNVPVVQVDPSFEGLEGGVGSLIKWNPLANVSGDTVWKFLRAMEVPVNSLHSQGYVSIGCEPCTRPVLPGQHEREGRWWWEDSKAKECGLHKGNLESAQSSDSVKHVNGSADLFSSDVLALTREGIERLSNLQERKEAWLLVLYAPWCPFCQGMEASFNEVASKLKNTGVKVRYSFSAQCAVELITLSFGFSFTILQPE
eukprot:TRINITY_DN32_c0_g1_i2.p1 TRINITY_DN32_c0_g1~~TRINITY_DN32_c0_g1_i2.p1  ORF type:complete len:440 (-),score=59.21 TRINITY_DN32_c0_g1_i2:677-1996(-)